jgi:glutaredoxin
MARYQEEHMRIIHWFVGSLILFFDWLTSPKGIERASHLQATVDAKAKDFTLYQYKACPFCVKVRRSMKRQSLPIETRDAKRCAEAKQELLNGGGALKVPCLRIVNTGGNEQWMYESKEIIAYLEAQFAEAA